MAVDKVLVPEVPVHTPMKQDYDGLLFENRGRVTLCIDRGGKTTNDNFGKINNFEGYYLSNV